MAEDQPRLLELRLRNYRSVPDAVLEFEPLTILVGPNGAGKSNIVDALSLLSDAMNVQLRAALDARGGVESVRHRKPGARRAPRFGIGVRMLLSLGRRRRQSVGAFYGFEVRSTGDHNYVVSRERCYIPEWEAPYGASGFDRTEDGTIFLSGATKQNPGIDPQALLLPVLSGLYGLSQVRDGLASLRRYAITPDVIRGLHDPTPGHDLSPDGKNIASVVGELQRTRPDDYRRLCEFLGRVVPGIEKVEPIHYGSKRGLRYSQRVNHNGRLLALDAASMSDGTLRVTGILAAIFQHPRPLLMAIEEPESTIHPGALGVLMDILRHGGDRSQIVITTHSPDVLDTPDLTTNSIKLVQWADGGTTISPIGPASAQAIESGLSTVGELLRSNYLRPADDAITDPASVELFPKIPEAPL